ncbi:hypothetical protein MFRU_015g01790 [Monilinia fructicola]|nr:hypothetical protein MFRU_015g01790 [Monilinia fructicola]
MDFYSGPATQQRNASIKTLKQRLRYYDFHPEPYSEPTNTAMVTASLHSNTRVSIQISQMISFLRIIASYYCEIDQWNIDRRPLLEIDNELYKTVKELGDDGYLPEDFVEWTTKFRNDAIDAQPAKTTFNQIFRLVKYMVEATTSITMHNLDPGQSKPKAKDRIYDLTVKLTTYVYHYAKQAEASLRLDPPGSDQNNELERFVAGDTLDILLELRTGVDMGTIPASKLLPSCPARFEREKLDFEKRLRTYQREDDEGKACLRTDDHVIADVRAYSVVGEGDMNEEVNRIEVNDFRVPGSWDVLFE